MRKNAWLHAVPVSLFVLAVLYDWFAVANRYVIFLYGHLGAGPFDRTTASRYWMSGLVVSGFVAVLYTAANGVIGRIAVRRRRRFSPPSAHSVWLLCLPWLLVGIPLMTMTANHPVLSAPTAVACTLATAVGLLVALLPGRLAAERPGELIWLLVAGAGLMPALLLLRAVEFAGRVKAPEAVIYAIAVAGTLLGAAWTCVVARLHAKRRRTQWSWLTLALSGAGLSYLGMPLVHFVLFTPAQYRYITVSENFYSSNALFQSLVIAVMALAAWIAVAVQDVGRSEPSEAAAVR